MKKILFLVFLSFTFLLSSYQSKAQKLSVTEQKRVNDIFKKGNTTYFKFPISSRQELLPLSKIITIDRTEGRVVYAHANKDQFSKFIGKGYPYTIVKTTNSATKKPKGKK
jgi:hypothetical protein